MPRRLVRASGLARKGIGTIGLFPRGRVRGRLSGETVQTPKHQRPGRVPD